MRGRLALLCLGVGCAGSLERVALLDPSALVPTPVERDPLAHERPAELDCPPGAWGPEGGGFEVQTGVCGYAAFDQPLGVDLEAGAGLEIIVWHDFLDAAEPGEGHVAIWIGSDIVWEARVAIPAASVSFEDEVVLPRAASADQRLGVHLHNHGFNSWRFVAIDHVGR